MSEYEYEYQSVTSLQWCLVVIMWSGRYLLMKTMIIIFNHMAVVILVSKGTFSVPGKCCYPSLHLWPESREIKNCAPHGIFLWPWQLGLKIFRVIKIFNFHCNWSEWFGAVLACYCWWKIQNNKIKLKHLYQQNIQDEQWYFYWTHFDSIYPKVNISYLI